MYDNFEHPLKPHPTVATLGHEGASTAGFFSCRTIFAELRAAAARLDEQLPYLFATGSSEACLRDALTYQLHTKHQNIAREYWVECNGQMRRADIAVLSEHGPKPKIIIELKQLYLKDFYLRDLGRHGQGSVENVRHKYISNIVKDVTDRRSACVEVYGVIFVRRVVPDGRLPCANNCAHVYIEDDKPFVSRGIEQMHRAVSGLPCAADYYPTNWEEARILHQKEPHPGVELYGWVIRAA